MRKETKENVLVASSRVEIFNNKDFGKVKLFTIDGEPWFVEKDIAETLWRTKARNAISNHVLEEGKRHAPVQDGLGGKQNMTIINESGLYILRTSTCKTI